MTGRLLDLLGAFRHFLHSHGNQLQVFLLITGHDEKESHNIIFQRETSKDVRSQHRFSKTVINASQNFQPVHTVPEQQFRARSSSIQIQRQEEELSYSIGNFRRLTDKAYDDRCKLGGPCVSK